MALVEGTFNGLRVKQREACNKSTKNLKSMGNSDRKTLLAFFMLQCACRIYVLCFFCNTLKASVFVEKRKYRLLAKYL